MKRIDPRRALAFAFCTLLGAALAGLAVVPATYADAALARATQGRVRLAQAEGTIWNGSARLVLAEGASGTGSTSGTNASFRAGTLVSGVAIPGRVDWSIRALPLLVGQLDASLRLDRVARPVRVHGSWNEVRIDAGALELPAVELGGLGSPWNTVQPAGALSLSWENLVLRPAGLDGRARVELRGASSAMTPVRPLGSYRIDVVGRGARAELSIETIDGPLRLQGNGSFDAKRGLRFVAEASAEARERDRLQSFLGLIGPREGERTIIRIGA
ncbi:MAG TPA: type II secretion system protein N [Zeimonas sp.]